MRRYELLKLLFMRLLRKQKFKLLAVILQIALGIFIIMPTLNFYFHFMRVSDYFTDKYGSNTFIISKYTHNLKAVPFDKNEIADLTDSGFLSQMLIEHSSRKEDKSQAVLSSIVQSNLIATELVDRIRALLTESNFSGFHKDRVAYGRYFSDREVSDASKVVVISKGVSEAIFGTQNGVGMELHIDDYGTFNVIGILENVQRNLNFQEKTFDFYFPYTCFIGSSEDAVYNLYIKTAHGYDYTELKEGIEGTVLGKSGGVLISFDNYTEHIMKSLDSFRISVYTTLIFGLLLLCISYFGNVGISLSFFYRRLRILGIEQALGAKPGTVAKEIIAENSIIYIMGTIAGIFASIPFKTYLNSVNPLYAGAYFEGGSIAIVLVITMLFALLSSILLVAKLNSYHVIELLRSEKV